MIETFELYILQPDLSRSFVPLTCQRGELLSKAQAALDHANAIGCDVEQFGHVVLRLAKYKDVPAVSRALPEEKTKAEVKRSP